jgi:hypothetical protein
VASPNLSGVLWCKSSFSGNNGTCVEVADLSEAVAVRDSKDPVGPALLFRDEAWSAFLAVVKTGELRARC